MRLLNLVGMQISYTNHNVTRPTCLNVQRDLMWSLVREDEGLLNASICYGIWSLESKGIAVDQIQALQCRRSLYANINHRVDAEARNPSDGLLLVVAAVICTLYETRSPLKNIDTETEEVSAHVNGFKSLIRAKGGWYPATTSMGELAWLCAWADITVNGELSVGFVLPPTDPFLSFSPSQYGCFPIDLCLILYAEELVRAYAAFRHTALINRQPAPSSSNIPCCKPLDLFRKGSHLHRLIEAGTSRSLRPICSLLLVHLILQFCQSQPSTSQLEWFTILKSRLEAADALRNGSVETLLWGLMTEIRTRTLWQRPFLEILVRHLYVERRLSISTQRRLKDTLLEFLDVGPADGVTGPGKRLELAWWTPEVFRHTIYRDLGYNFLD